MKVMNDKQLNRFYSILISTTLLTGLVGCCAIITDHDFIFGSCVAYMIVCATHVAITSYRVELHEQVMKSFETGE